MNVKNMAIIGAVVIAAATILILKQAKKVVSPAEKVVTTGVVAAQGEALPRLLDLGAGKCIPCKMMKPILDDLMANYAKTFKTEFIDVWEDADAATPYKINLIPTQIFFGVDGKELFRHEGFFSKEDILNKWKELGVSTSNQ